MTIALPDLGLYAFAIFLLFLTPGPVWLALTARALSGGFRSAWPLAVGVTVGDLLWPLLAILGVGWVVSVFGGFLTVLRLVACLVFICMGVLLIRHADAPISADGRLTRPGRWAGFVSGVMVILANPKAILFYMGVLPGFFDLRHVTGADIAVICALSVVVPLAGNLTFALLIGRMRRFLTSPRAFRRLNLISGWLLIAVGLVIPLT